MGLRARTERYGCYNAMGKYLKNIFNLRYIINLKYLSGLMIAFFCLGCTNSWFNSQPTPANSKFLIWKEMPGYRPEFYTIRRICLKESLAQASGNFINPNDNIKKNDNQSETYSGYINRTLFESCMNSYGWFLSPEYGGENLRIIYQDDNLPKKKLNPK